MSTLQQEPHAGVEIDARGIATVTIREAGSLNILSTPVIASLTRAIEALAAQDALRVLVLRGTGDKGFIGGADIKEMAALDRASAEAFISGLRRLCDAVRHLPVPVIARMPGWCLGGGLELALACDLRIAADTAQLGMPEVKVGIPSVIHAALMPRLIGNARTAWMLLTGEISDAAEALQWGLVSRVVPLAELDLEVERVAALLAGFGPVAVRQQKRLLREWEDAPLEVSINNSVTEFGSAFDTGEPQQHMATFLNRKR
ncbi:Putative enoyl-CoA hydratase/isomerase [Cupriavidus taiwanensis]|uniref:Enoyl-CoA hydratase/isomerase n=1 Tax=Cupriavidus taiwanensis TaxID=164546 RepID=A0A976G3Z9_9BURK|nr:enoyl-CoA hydratase [Cupriavidus taiwanensis]SOZ17381.1 Putative enoyl-CoA hydratase/isomerase [Cupriavidus taiwanensis]SOZ29732.1 Putative enoyl-CoA hydratase/isomerase [Cupriavidus taiwanensis]SOZ46904.1 Putative enoyl-CoA hydratase/isomerase [Cupriavidus taiwanensis]SOZ62224.1 Putative enoyl-CoA hydratase/isomerase [Cupriavidus taiwanensis]SOZ62393.1 Putative enoyl-CoA hydratase/isomerase [Cupriavidus taiwanensis]